MSRGGSLVASVALALAATTARADGKPPAHDGGVEVTVRLGLEDLGFATSIVTPVVSAVPATLEVDVGGRRTRRTTLGGYLALLGGRGDAPYAPHVSRTVLGASLGYVAIFRAISLPLFFTSELGGAVLGVHDYWVAGGEVRTTVGFEISVSRGLSLQVATGLKLGAGSGLWGAWIVSLGLVHPGRDPVE